MVLMRSRSSLDGRRCRIEEGRQAIKRGRRLVSKSGYGPRQEAVARLWLLRLTRKYWAYSADNWGPKAIKTMLIWLEPVPGRQVAGLCGRKFFRCTWNWAWKTSRRPEGCLSAVQASRSLDPRDARRLLLCGSGVGSSWRRVGGGGDAERVGRIPQKPSAGSRASEEGLEDRSQPASFGEQDDCGCQGGGRRFVPPRGSIGRFEPNWIIPVHTRTCSIPCNPAGAAATRRSTASESSALKQADLTPIPRKNSPKPCSSSMKNSAQRSTLLAPAGSPRKAAEIYRHRESWKNVPDREWAMSWDVAVSFLAGDYAETRRVLEKLGDRLNTKPLGLMHLDLARVKAQVYALTGEGAPRSRNSIRCSWTSPRPSRMTSSGYWGCLSNCSRGITTRTGPVLRVLVCRVGHPAPLRQRRMD